MDTCDPSWENESNSVGQVRVFTGPFVHVSNGSGTLVNNEAQNGRPFFLTAFHVLDVDKSGTLSTSEKSALAYLEVRFDFRWTTCPGSTVMTFITMTGATFRSAWEPTDFALIELDQNPPLNSRVRYAGWSRSGSTPSTGIAIHHIAAEHMRYSETSGTAIRVYPFNFKFFEIIDWGIGFVGPGSSGSALFNENHQVVGVLSRGKDNADCGTLFESYKYGRFYDSWTGGGTSETQLKHWLSPSSNLSSMNTFDRLKLNISAPVCFGSNTTYTLSNIYPGEMPVWSVGSSSISIVSSTSSSVTVTATNPTTSGATTITASFGNESVTKEVWYGKPAPFSIMYQDSASGHMSVSSSNFIQPGLLELVATFYSAAPSMPANIAWNSSPSGVIGAGPYGGIAYTNLWAGQSMSFSPVASNTCGSTPHFSFTFTVPSSLLVYPNPATNSISISREDKSSFSDSIEKIELLSSDNKSPSVVYFSNGAPSKGVEIKSDKITLDIRNLTMGVYFIRVIIKNQKKEEVYKFIKS